MVRLRKEPRKPPFSPVKKAGKAISPSPSSSDSEEVFTTPATSRKSLHKKFGDETLPIPQLNLETKEELSESPKDGAINVEQDSEEDSDEAPEEEGILESATISKQILQESRKAELKLKKLQKEERRARDSVLKQQKLAKLSRKEADTNELLPQELLDQLESHPIQKTNDIEPDISDYDTPEKVFKKKPVKTVFQKGPVKVQVLVHTNKALAPRSDGKIAKQREKWLKRRSIVRR